MGNHLAIDLPESSRLLPQVSTTSQAVLDVYEVRGRRVRHTDLAMLASGV